MTIIDTHVHINDPNTPNHRLVLRAMPETLKAIVKPDRVDGIVVVEAWNDPHENDWTLALAEHEPFIVGYVGTLDIYSEQLASALARYTANPIFSGIRIHTLDHAGAVREKIALENAGHLAAANRALDLHMGYQTLSQADNIARENPDLALVVNHMAQTPLATGTLNPDWVRVVTDFAQHPLAFMKVSALLQMLHGQPSSWSRAFNRRRAVLPTTDPEYYRAAIDVVWNAFGEDRLIHASNWPQIEHVGTYGDEINIVRTYFERKGSVASEKFFADNAKQAYRWVERR